MRTRAVITLTASVVLLSMSLQGSWAQAAATLWVANDGTDTGTCGTKSAPCRSISQAIENAADGDTIEVGQGRYGDITGSGTFTGGGDEHGQSFSSGDGGCLVCITKSVHIFSLYGAAVTLIQGVAGTQFDSTVVIAHDGVTFGAKDHGFTVTGGNRTGVSVLLNPVYSFAPISIVAPIRIGGNIDIGDGTGFGYRGTDLTDTPCPYGCVFTGQVLFSDNEANSNGVGFAIYLGQSDHEPVLLLNNVARNGGTGFMASPGLYNESAYVLGSGGNVSLLSNVATGNGTGFNANSLGDIRGNIASGNSQIGFLIVPGGGLFTGNSAIGNAGPGVIVQYSRDNSSPDIVDLGPGAIPSFRSFSGNDFYGNDRNRPLLQLSVPFAFGPDPIYNPGPSAHCGVLNIGALIGPIQGVLGPAITLNATGNFWGSSTGPSASGPGDAAGGACDQNNATTTTRPFAAAVL